MKPEERDRVQFVVRNAYRAGRDPVESLDRNRLLFTNQRYKETRSDAYHALALELENSNIINMIKFHYGGNGATAQDAQRAITAWIRALARKEAP